MKNNLFEIVNRNQISSQTHLEFYTADNVGSYQPNIIFSLDSVAKIDCDMDILFKHSINEYLAQSDFNPVTSNIEEIREDGKPIYVKYSYWLKLNDNDEIYPLSKNEYQYLRYKLGFDDNPASKWSTKAKYPTIEELKEYVK